MQNYMMERLFERISLSEYKIILFEEVCNLIHEIMDRITRIDIIL